MPLGKKNLDHIEFVGGQFEIQPGDQNYIFSDRDLFGCEKCKKLMIKRMRKLIISIAHLPMDEQHERIETEFNNRKGDVE